MGWKPNLKTEILVALTDSGCFATVLPISEARLLLQVPTAYSAPPDRDDRDVFALEKPGSVLDQCVTDFPDLGPQSVPI